MCDYCERGLDKEHGCSFTVRCSGGYNVGVHHPMAIVMIIAWMAKTLLHEWYDYVDADLYLKERC